MPRTKQALIIDDDQDVTGELKLLLNGLGYKVTTLQNASAITDAIGTRQYEVALVNMRLPDANWRRTFRAVKTASKTTTVIMMARSPDEDDLRYALNAGSYIVLNRPLSRDQLNCIISPRNDGLFVVLR